MYAIWTKTKQSNNRWEIKQFEIPLDVMDREYHMLEAELLHEDDPDIRHHLETWILELNELRDKIRQNYFVYFTLSKNITTPTDGGYIKLSYPHYVAIQRNGNIPS